MRIKTQYMMTMLLFGVVLLGISASVLVTNKQVEDARQEEQVADNVAQGADELSYLSNDYVIYRESQQLGRWQSRFASFSADVAGLQADTPEESGLVQDIQANRRRLKEVFDSIAAAVDVSIQNKTGPLDLSFVQVSWSRIAVQSQGLISDASRLAQLKRGRADQLQSTNLYAIFAMVIIFGAYFVVIYLLVQRRALKSIAKLQEGTAVIGSGNLDFKMEEKKNDEVGDLSRAFNRMTSNLKFVTASKSSLEKEVTERKIAEGKTKELVEELRLHEEELAEQAEELRLAHQRAQESRDKYLDLYEYAPAGYLTLEKNGTILEANLTAARLLGLERSDIINSPFSKFIVPDYQDAFCFYLSRTLESGTRQTRELAIHKKDGSVFHGQLESIAMNSNGIPDHIRTTLSDISERKKAEEALKESEEKYRRIVDTASEGIWICDTNARTTFVNKRVVEMLGYSEEEMMGKTLYEFLDEEARDLAKSHLDRRLLGLRDTYEQKYLRKDGSTFWAITSASPLLDKNNKMVASLGMITDINERKEMEDALKDAEAKASALIRYAPTGIYEIDYRGPSFISLNDATCILTGYTREELFALGPMALLSDDSKQLFVDRMRRQISGEQIIDTADYKVVKKDGSIIFVTLNVSFSSEKPHTALVIGHDITERKKAEEALQKYTAEVEDSNKELESFSYTVSHDLRAPLRSLDGYSEALLEDYSDRLDEQGKKWLRSIRSSSQHMGRLIDDILGLSRVIRTELKVEAVNLTKIAQSQAARLREAQPERQVEFVITPGMEVTGDNNLLTLAVENLLSNAFKFTVGRQPARIEFGLNQQGGEKVYFVKDNGAGFEMKYVNKLFKPFQRLHNSKDYPGTGIGLVTVQRIVQRHGGKVWAEGMPDEGASFYFTIDEERSRRS